MARLGTTADYFLGEGDAERPPMQPSDESPTVTPCPCTGDIHKLGAPRAQDNDGDACESLPGGFRVIR